MYLARNLTPLTLQQIGRYFGGRDHTTVSYSCRKTEERIQSEPEIEDAAFAIQHELQETQHHAGARTDGGKPVVGWSVGFHQTAQHRHQGKQSRTTRYT
jgi:hypothetical protein